MTTQNRAWQVAACLAFSSFFINAQFDRHAGVLASFSKNATPAATSQKAGNAPSLAIDGDEDSGWQSAPTLPSAFLAQAHNNALLNSSGGFTASASSGTANLTDGNPSTGENISKSGGTAWLKLTLPQPTFLRFIALKASSSAPLELWIFDAQGDSSLLGNYVSAQNYSVERYLADTLVSAVKIKSTQSFLLFEIAAVEKALYEDLTLDLGQSQEIGYAYACLRSGNAVDSAQIAVSQDSVNWTTVARPNPALYFSAPYRASPVLTARYVRLRSFVKEKGWARAQVQELKLFDQNGKYGPLPAPSPATRAVGKMVGVNTVWGWGHGDYADQCAANEGPNLYKDVITHARNYHNLKWDTDDPDNTPNYGGMPGSLQQSWLDWDREYQEWQKAGITVQSCIQFLAVDFPESDWANPYQAGYDFGYEYASHFGPGGNGLVERIEVGNEPWGYDSTFYRDVLHGMAKGAKTADPSMKVFSCALQAADPATESSSYRNFMGARLSPREIPYLDGINVHHYSYKRDEASGDRIATFPEDPASGMRGLVSDIRFRDANLPGKEIYVSEWGWDSQGSNQPCTHHECVSEKAQAIYALRGLLLMDRLGVNRATWFFYANTAAQTSGLYSRCGLTAAVDSGSAPKRSFVTFFTMLEKIGNCYFLDTLAENDDVWAYLYGDSLGNATYVVAWKPIDAEDPSTGLFEINFPQKADSAWTVSGQNYGGSVAALPIAKKGRLNIPVSAVPILVKLDTAVAGGGVGLEERARRESHLTVFPNPNDGDFTVEIILKEGGLLETQLLDLSGKVVRAKQFAVGAGETQISFSEKNLTPSFYFLRTRLKNNPDARRNVAKIVIAR